MSSLPNIHLNTEQGDIAEDRVEVHKHILDHDVDVRPRPLDDVLIVHTRKYRAQNLIRTHINYIKALDQDCPHLDQYEHCPEPELHKAGALVLALLAGRAGARLGPAARGVHHAAPCQDHQRQPLLSAQRPLEQDLEYREYNWTL